MPKAYWIAHVTITNPDRYVDYQSLAPQAFIDHGARFLARGGKHETLEGDAFDRHVVIEFESLETALACYHSDAYQAARRHRDGACKVMVNIVEGIDGKNVATESTGKDLP